MRFSVLTLSVLVLVAGHENKKQQEDYLDYWCISLLLGVLLGVLYILL